MLPRVDVVELETPHGPARAHVEAVGSASGAVVLGHGAGGGVGGRDLGAAAGAARELGLGVALVEQPYRVAGRRSPAPAAQLDAAWAAVVEQLGLGGPLVAGGRSSGARVACRTAAATGAAAVLCLAFPVHPPGRPERTRLPELDAVAVPVLVVQGARDPFGMPPPASGRSVVEVAGNHSLSGDIGAIRAAIHDWLASLAESGFNS
jgi:predicted alpha/beta-hydrolase family hydrolase